MQDVRNIQVFDGHHPQLKKGAWVHPDAVVIGRVFLGENSSVWPNATLRGDEGEIRIGDGSNIQDGTTVHMTGGESNTTVGARVTVGHNVILHGCAVEDDCLIGMGAILLDNCVIGRGSYIGAGTLITGGKVIPPGSFVFGNPHRIIRACGPREQRWISHAWAHYIELKQRHARS